MNKSTSIYLDFLRIVAAFGVLIVHASLPWFSGLFLAPLEIGNKLVMIFFVLSGFLISFTVEKKNKGSRQYLIDRLSRLYSVVLPALILTFIIDNIGKNINQGFYSDKMLADDQIFRYLLNITFLSQIWNFSTKPSTNGPFWSLSYEFWYYIIFWAWTYLKGNQKIIWLIIICVIIGPKILLLFPVWLLGVLAYKCSIADKFKISVVPAIAIFVGTFFTLTFFMLTRDFSPLQKKYAYGGPPLFFSGNFIYSWIFGTVMAINLWSFSFISYLVNIPEFVENSIKKLSSITFSLYLYHFPMLIFAAAVIPYNKFSVIQVILVLLGIIALVTVLSSVTEKQRNNVKSVIGKYLLK